MNALGGGWRAFLIGLVLLVGLSHGWMVGLPFMNDDWRQVGEAVSLDGPAVLLANEKETDDGHGRPRTVSAPASIRFSTPAIDSQPSAFRWYPSAPGTTGNVLHRMGLSSVPLYRKVEGIRGHPDNGPQAESRSRRIVVVP